MKKVIVMALLGLGIYQAWGQLGVGQSGVERLKDQPYVVVYGRDSCGFTSEMRRKLSRAGIDFRYAKIDRPEVAKRIHQRMSVAGIDTRRYNLPVVDVNGHIHVRPKPKNVIKEFRGGGV
jgi:glutaredoxin